MAIAPASSWVREWNSIIRSIIFPDSTLKQLMLIPNNTTLINFVDKYFIRVGYSDTTLTNEDVRIVYGNIMSKNADNNKAFRQEISFDIFVRKEHAHDVGDDRLMLRGELIQERLRQLLEGRITVNGQDTAYKLRVVGMNNLGSSTIGYNRFNITFEYIHT